MGHEHVTKVLEFRFDDDHNWKPGLYGCTGCDETSLTPFESNDVFVDHANCGPECFGCKAKSLQLSTGDAGRDVSDKKWVGELDAYKQARSQGIQPAGTTHRHIQEAYTASETLNKPYNADVMPKATDINKKSVEALKEIGAI
jgi:hypothetical protein